MSKLHGLDLLLDLNIDRPHSLFSLFFQGGNVWKIANSSHGYARLHRNVDNESKGRPWNNTNAATFNWGNSSPGLQKQEILANEIWNLRKLFFWMSRDRLPEPLYLRGPAASSFHIWIYTATLQQKHNVLLALVWVVSVTVKFFSCSNSPAHVRIDSFLFHWSALHEFLFFLILSQLLISSFYLFIFPDVLTRWLRTASPC